MAKSAIINGQRFTPFADDQALPPLFVGIYSASGILVETHRLIDPRTAFCIEHNTVRPMTAPLYAKPLVAAVKSNPKASKRSGKAVSHG